MATLEPPEQKEPAAVKTEAHARNVTRLLFSIADAVNTTYDLDHLYRQIHLLLGESIDTTNFFIALVDLNKKTIQFPYFVDIADDDYSEINNFDTSRSLTGIVALARRPMLLRDAELRSKERQSAIMGTTPLIWMGVPLMVRDEVIGVVAAQSYSNPNAYDEDDLHLLAAVSHQIALAIDRKHSLDELRRSEERYRLLFENLHDALVLIDKAGLIIEHNSRALEMTGYTHNELSKISFIELIAPEDRASVARALNDFASTDHQIIQTSLIAQDGRALNAELSSRLTPVPGKDLIQIIIRDITERKQAEEALRESEEQFRQIITTVREGILRLDTEWRITFANNHLAEMFGYDLDELVGQPFELLLHEGDLEDFARRKNERQQGQNSQFERRFRTKDGREIWTIVSASAVFDKSGHFAGSFGTITDITERKQAEKILREREETFRNIVHASPMGIHLYELQNDDSLVFVGTNPAADKLLGVDNTKFIGMTLEEAFPPLKDTEIPFRYRRAAAFGKSWHTEQVEYDHDKIAGAFEVYVFQMSLGKVAVMFTDITERKRAGEQLRKTEEQFRNLYDEAPVGYFEYDLKGDITRVNNTYLRLLGYSPEEILGQPCWNFIVDEVAREQILAKLKGIRPPDVGFECLYRRKDGTTFPVLFEDRLLSDEKGQIRGVRTAIQDITERKRAETEREKLQTQLIQAQKMDSIGRLAGGVAHDFNNMLSVIIGHTELAMLSVGESQPLFQRLKGIHEAADHAADFTRQLLAFARKQTINLQALDLNKTVEGMLNMLQHLIGENIALSWSPGQGLASIRMDPSQIDQILINLCINARDAIPGTGRIIIETNAVSLDEAYCSKHTEILPGNYIQLIVSDTGCGMDDKTLSLLFEPFYTTKETGKGTGLGMAMVYGIVKQNNGFINVYSEPDRGTTFRLYFPCCTDQADLQGGKEWQDTPSQGNATILLVEDGVMILDITKTMLETLGYTVLAATTPEEAINLAKKHGAEIDILLTDVIMPQMNGRDLSRNILGYYPNIKCIFMSGYTDDIIAHHGVLDVGVHFIQKPFSMADLAKKMRESLNG